ncbi:MAG: glycosyltransferase [Candidatus Sumerlaeaceae bacterium]
MATVEHKKVKIAYLITSLDVGGSERQLVAWVKGLPKDRYECHILCLSGFGPLEEAARHAGAILHDLRYPRKRAPGTIRGSTLPAAFAAWLRLLLLLKRLKPDILHTMIPACNVLGGVAGRVAGVRRMICTKLALGHYRDNSHILARLENIVDPWFNLIHCKSRAIAEDVLRREPVPAHKLRLVYNGIDLTRFDKLPPREIMRAELGLPVDAIVVGTVANLIPYKGHREIVEAAALLVPKFPQMKFLWVGRDDGIAASLFEQAQLLGVAENICFLGPRQDIPRVLAAVDMLVSASHEEGFSNVILEAMAAGLPVVATRVGGNPEAVVDGETGYIVAPKDPTSLAAAIEKLAAEPDLARTMGEKGRVRVRANFSYEAMILGLERLYDELLTTIA